MELSAESQKLAGEYAEITADPEYRKLSGIVRHSFTNTYDHSIRVALMSVKMAEKLGMDPECVVRAALLHDFCLIDYHAENPDCDEFYAFKHPKDAVVNSKKFGLTEAEEKAILSHMFPLGPMPTNKPGWIITAADKVVAVYEKLYGIRYVADFIRYGRGYGAV